jgi:cholesterol oxidase
MPGDPSRRDEHVDAVVVGSGFGGSVVASRLAEAGWSVCVLERGRPYPPMSFPRSTYDMARNSWDPSGGTYGLFDFWSFSGLSSVVSSGLGGGSLIYSSVMLRKPPEWFVDEELPGGGRETWPVTYEELAPHYDTVERRLGLQRYPLDVEPYSGTARTHAVLGAARALGLEHELPPLAVTFGNQGQRPVPGVPLDERGATNLHGAARSTCRLVGECNLGCNYGSKNTLDLTYLSDAQRSGAQLRTLCEVRAFERSEDGFAVDYVQHDEEGTSATAQTRRITTSHLVLSAGTFGTTYLLLRNRAALPGLSPALGSRFSSNGDALGLAIDAQEGSGADRRPRLLHPTRGPVITAAMKVPDSRAGASGRGFYVQDGGYPDLVDWMVEQSLPLLAPRVVRFLVGRLAGRLRGRSRAQVSGALRSVLGRATFAAASTPLAGMGRDVPDGRFRLRDGLLDLQWDERNSRVYFEQVHRQMREVAGALGASYLPRGPALQLLVSAHPLGGVPMARDPAHGVVDPHGQVFGCPGLVVADGSVMPGPVGANPSLTIAAVADRSADRLLEQGRGTVGWAR